MQWTSSEWNTFSPRLACNHAQHQSCTICLPTLLLFQDCISLKLLYDHEQSLTWIIVSFQQLDFVVVDQIQVAPTNIANIVQHFHCPNTIWETIGNQSQEQLALLVLTSHNAFVHDNNVGYCKGLIPCLHEQVNIVSPMLICKTIWMFKLCASTMYLMLIVVIPFSNDVLQLYFCVLPWALRTRIQRISLQ